MQPSYDPELTKEASPARSSMQGLSQVDYVTYRPLLLRMLGSLARNGYAVPPDDGLDLVHDFFIEAWTGVVHRHDPEKAPFPAFLNHTFLAFARPRIIRLKRWRTALLDPAEMAHLQEVQHVVIAEREHTEHVLLVRAVVQSMAPKDRRLFQIYVSGTNSEREIAHQFGLTRYGLRSRLVDIFGEFAVRFSKLSHAPVTNDLVVHAIWHQHRTAKEAASFLQIPVPEVQAVRTKMYRILVAAVKGERMMDPISFYVSRRTDVETPDAKLLLQRLISAGPGDKERAIADVRANADTILSYFETGDRNDQFAGADGEILAQVYFALAGERDADEAVSPVEATYLQAIADEEAVIGQAFKQSLLANLPEDLLNADLIFEGIPRLDISDFRHLISDITVENGGAFARDLAMYGVTPGNILAASLAVARLARRKGDRIGLGRGDALTVTRYPASGAHVVEIDELYQAVAMVTELEASVAARLTDWLLAVAGYVPLLFDMFHSEPAEDGVQLILTEVRNNDLYIRWNGNSEASHGASADLATVN